MDDLFVKSTCQMGPLPFRGYFLFFTGVYPSYYKAFSSNPTKNSYVLVNELKSMNIEFIVLVQVI